MITVAVVLVDTLYGGNLGGAARAMMNFGLSDLRLVRPAPGIMEDPQLLPMARGGARPVLENAKIYPTLAEALADVELALGFTARLGKKRTDGDDLRPGVERIFADPPKGTVAAVFGSEDKGLSNADLEICHRMVRVPTSKELPSLNLAQAVGLFAYEVSVSREKAANYTPGRRNVATVAELEGLYAQVEEVLELIGFIEEKSPARMMNQMRRIISRREPDPRDVRILRGVLSKVTLAVERARAGKL